MSNIPQISPRPGLLRRLIAMLYDTLLVLPLIMTTVAAAMAIHAALNHADAEPLPPLVVQILALATCFLFFALFWLKSGQTLGMQAWRVKLVSMTGQPISVWQALRRCLGAALSALCLGLGYLWCLVDRNRRYWHDYLSGTELVLVEKNAGKTTTGHNKNRLSCKDGAR